ncbi:LytR/AlgR family response regulator transcription factor [Gaoshiqia sp. Z1-71]|uniref:LytR/AlgR family response regulator transcription factor n=1 Tax=Gaoshiqia hydrogeniformans TaxID=3290090 RepID=UPI003BF90444
MKKVKLKALIVDDEKDARDLLRYYLTNNPGISAIEEADSAESALFKYLDFSPDIVFLDIIMPGKSGGDLIELLKKKDPDCNIVIVSAHEEAALTAIENSVYDFILKPLTAKKLGSVIEKYRSKMNIRLDEKLNRVLDKYDDGVKIRISTVNSHILVDPSDILYCESNGAYTSIYLENGKRATVNTNLGRLEKILPAQHFIRLSRAYLINLDRLIQVKRGDKSCILLARDRQVKLYGSSRQIKILCEMDFD